MIRDWISRLTLSIVIMFMVDGLNYQIRVWRLAEDS